jgi:adenosylcobinamide-phosphate synthase
LIMEIILVLILALIIDLVFGEPPTVIHPVGWMGKAIAFMIKPGKDRSSKMQLVWGLVVVMAAIGLFVTPVYFGLLYCKNFNIVLYIVLSAVILKTSFALKGLRLAGLKIRSLLAQHKLADARFELQSLVGRDTSTLDNRLVVSATVESLAENSCDSFVAPLFYFLFLGVPGAIGYRVINTLDAMIGHHGEFEYLGKIAAMLDTIANFIPARITALAIVGSSWIGRQKASAAWRVMFRDWKNTESPNAGWTMGAIAGALGVQLEKVGHYKLGDSCNSLVTETIDASLRLVTTATFIWIVIVILAEVIYHVTT